MCSVVNVRSVERRRAVNSESARAPLSIIAPLYEKLGAKNATELIRIVLAATRDS
jgi:hypothetical protein